MAPKIIKEEETEEIEETGTGNTGALKQKRGGKNDPKMGHHSHDRPERPLTGKRHRN